MLAELTGALRKQRSEELAANATQEAVKRLQAGETLESLAKAAGSAPQAPKFVARPDQTVPVEIREAAFAAPKPADKPVFKNVTLANGDSAVFAFSAVRVDPPPDMQTAQLKRQYAEAIAQSEAIAYAGAARADAKVQLNPKAIE